MKHLKRTYTFVFVSLLVLLTYSNITGCKPISEPIRLFDSNQVTHISFRVDSESKDLPLLYNKQIDLKKTNANNSKDYLFLMQVINQHEREIFERRKNDESFVPLDSLTKDLRGDYPYQLQIDLYDEDNLISSYILAFNEKNTEGILTGNNHTSQLAIETVEYILTSNLLPLDPTLVNIPSIEVTYGDSILELSEKGTWNQYYYPKRFVSSTVQNIQKTSPYSIGGEEAGNITFTFRSNQPDKIMVLVKDPLNKDQTISSTVLDSIQATNTYALPKENKAVDIYIECTWKKESNQSYGSLSYSFPVNIELQESFTLNKAAYEPGDLVVVEGKYIDEDLNYDITCDLYNEGINFIENNETHYLLIPIMSRATPKDYILTITDTDHPDDPIKLTIPVIYKKFEEQHLETSSSTASLQNQENYDQLNEAFARGRQNLHTEKLWDGPFLQPVGGRISTQYGQIRYTNGSDKSSVHSGIDFANPEGTPVLATQNGYVTLAEELNITGNTLFIDHGFGIVSQYYHLLSFDVNVGDYVEAGQHIANVGTTGFSTGPHLHFAIYNKGIYLNPWKFFEEAPF